MSKHRSKVSFQNLSKSALDPSVVVPGTEKEEMTDINCLEIMKDFPSGPLDVYRKKASFDWKEMKMFLDGEDILRFKVRSPVPL